jgi:hypothetical protein
MEKFRLAALVSLVAFQASCSTAPQGGGGVGVVRAALVAVPPDVSCIRLEVQGDRFNSQDFDVTPGMNATLLMTGVSTGSVVVTVKAFSVACAQVTDAIAPSWVSDPVSTQVGTAGVTDVSVDLHRNGQLSVGISFTDDPACGADGGFCAPATCSDGAKNGTESDIDCGGTCRACGVGQSCKVASDCTSLTCTRGRCAPGGGGCSDGIIDGDETNVDCGGTICPPCATGRCNVGSDCASGICKDFMCVASCTDGVKNGSETDVDCGGKCSPCGDGLACTIGADCASGACNKMICGPSGTCSDGVTNGTETDIDCGGGTCPPCGDGRCRANTDCASGMCNHFGSCDASCTDGVRDGTETDVDCGGTSGCNPCTVGQKCQVNTDCDGQCVAGICTSKVCNPIPGAVAWWHADDTFDDAIGGLGALPLGTVAFAPGFHNDGFSFDGSQNSFVQTPDDPALDFAGEFTIDLWINPTGNGGNGRLVDKMQPFGNDGWLLHLVGFHLGAIIGNEGLGTAATVPAGTFTHVALSYSPGVSFALYINGVQAATGTTTQTATPVNAHPVVFGADQEGGTEFAGVMDEVRFWNRALDGKAIQSLVRQATSCP